MRGSLPPTQAGLPRSAAVLQNGAGGWEISRFLLAGLIVLVAACADQEKGSAGAGDDLDGVVGGETTEGGGETTGGGGLTGAAPDDPGYVAGTD